MKSVTLFAFLLSAISTATVTQAEPLAAEISDIAPNLVILRPSQQAHYSYLDYRLYLNGKSIGKLSNGEKMTFHLQPGHYTLVANDQKNSRISLWIEKGKTVTVNGWVNRGLQMSLRDVEGHIAQR